MAQQLQKIVVACAVVGTQAVRLDDEEATAPHHMAHIRKHHVEKNDVECSGWAPSHGPFQGKGGSCQSWGEELAWCFVSEDYPGKKEASKTFEGKFFAACEDHPAAQKANLAALKLVASKAKAMEAKIDEDTATSTLAHAKKVKKVHAQHFKEATAKKSTKDKSDAVDAIQAEEDHATATSSLSSAAAVAKKERQKDDRQAAEDAVLAKAAEHKAHAAMVAAKKATKAKQVAQDKEIAEAKCAEAAKEKADELAGPSKAATDADLAANEVLRKAHIASDEAVANHAVAEQNAFKKGQEAASAKETSESSAAAAAEAKCAHDNGVEVASEKDIIAKKAAKHAERINGRVVNVAAQKTVADREAKHAQEAKETAVAAAKVGHQHKEKAAKDSARADELAVAEVTIAEAAKEESHRATSKAFKALYNKVNSEDEVAKHTKDEAAAAAPVQEEASQEEEAAAAEAPEEAADDAATQSLLQIDEKSSQPKAVDTSKWPAEMVKELEDAGALPSEAKECPKECAAYSWAMMCEVPTCSACDQCTSWAPVDANMARLQKEQLTAGHYWPGGPCNKCTFLTMEEACRTDVCKDCQDYGIFCTRAVPDQKSCDGETEEEKAEKAEVALHKAKLEVLDKADEGADAGANGNDAEQTATTAGPTQQEKMAEVEASAEQFQAAQQA